MNSIKSLIQTLEDYDTARLKLEQHGGTLDDLVAITTILCRQIETQGRVWDHDARLIAPDSVQQLLCDSDAFSLQLSVRTLETRMPVYYLCRTKYDPWFEYSLIVDDLYMSPGYPLPEDRFVKLMQVGHESYYLRLSQFRSGVAQLLSAGEQEDCVDELLYDLGRHIFQAAWHEDQQLAFLTSQHFEIPQFRNAIELLYLSLSGDLCELRGAINGRMKEFLRVVYPQPAILRLLDLLPYIDGGDLNNLVHKAQIAYVRLAAAFAKFLHTEVIWGWRKSSAPLYKLVYGNVSRLSSVGKLLATNERVRQAKNALETIAETVIAELTDGSQMD